MSQILTEKSKWKHYLPSKDYIQQLEPYKDDPNIFISFVANLAKPTDKIFKSDNHRSESDKVEQRLKSFSGAKIGINPKSDWNTPLGIYTYPVKAFWKQISEDKIPFQGDMPYIWVLHKKIETKSLILDETYTEKMYVEDKMRLRQLWETKAPSTNDTKPVVFDDIAHKGETEARGQTFASNIWNVTRLLSQHLRPNLKASNTWNSVLRYLGYGNAEDYGVGLIHSNEPTQAVFFHKKAFEEVELIHSKKFKLEAILRKTFKEKDQILLKYLKDREYKIDLYTISDIIHKIDNPYNFIQALVGTPIYERAINQVIDSSYILQKYIQHSPKNIEEYSADMLAAIEQDAESSMHLVIHYADNLKLLPETILDRIFNNSRLVFEMYQRDITFTNIPSAVIARLESTTCGILYLFEKYNYDFTKISVEGLQMALSERWSTKYFTNLIEYCWDKKIDIPEEFNRYILRSAELCFQYAAKNDFNVDKIPKEYLQTISDSPELIAKWCTNVGYDFKKIPFVILQALSSSTETCYYIYKHLDYDLTSISPEYQKIILDGIKESLEYVRETVHAMNYDVKRLPKEFYDTILQSPSTLTNILYELECDIKKLPPEFLGSIENSETLSWLIFNNIGMKVNSITPKMLMNVAKSPINCYRSIVGMGYDFENIPLVIIEGVVRNISFCVTLAHRFNYDVDKLPPQIVNVLKQHAIKNKLSYNWKNDKIVTKPITKGYHEIIKDIDKTAKPKAAEKPKPAWDAYDWLEYDKPKNAPQHFYQQLKPLKKNKIYQKESVIMNDDTIRDNLFYTLFEEVQLTQEEDYLKYYEIFKNEYMKSTGKAWDYNKFRQRASNWTFYGNDTGFVAVRFQNSGFVKLVATAGNMKGKYSGIKEILAKKLPLWGVVTSDLATMGVKMGFIRPPAWVVKTLLKFIDPSSFGGINFTINPDGSLQIDGKAKYFIATKSYFKKFLTNFITKIPSIVKTFIEQRIK